MDLSREFVMFVGRFLLTEINKVSVSRKRVGQGDDMQNCFVLRVSYGKRINERKNLLNLSCEECRSR